MEQSDRSRSMSRAATEFRRVRSLALLGVLAALISIFAAGPGAATAFAASPPSAAGIRCEAATRTTLEPAINILSNELETTWRLESSPAAGGPFTQVTGATGTLPPPFAGPVLTHVTGLQAATAYFFRFDIENSAGHSISEVGRCETDPDVPRIEAFPEFSSITPTSAHLDSGVIPDGHETTWQFQSSPSESGPWSAAPGAGGIISLAEADENPHQVEGDLSGLSPETRYCARLFAENEDGPAIDNVTRGPIRAACFETGGKPLVSTFATHTYDDESIRILGSVTPRGADSRYRFQYAPVADFEPGACEWACPDVAETAEGDAGSGEYDGSLRIFPPRVVGEAAPGLQPGESYRFRILASNSAGSAAGSGQILSVPPLPVAGPPAPCPNEALRTGASARLPDCRAYEQVTPVEKGGTLDIGTYGKVAIEPKVAEDGERFDLKASGTQWGESPDSKNSTYSFDRTGAAWTMTPITPQPQAGTISHTPSLYSSELDALGLELGWSTSHATESPEVELQTGAPGGPYASVLSAPRASNTTWVAASADFSTQLISSEDRTLAGAATGTKSGPDLYEWAEGALRQTNVLSNGNTIGTCGATVPEGVQGYQNVEAAGGVTDRASAHSIAADGSRIYFEAVPAGACSEARHLYIREPSAENTVDVGPYVFLGVDPAGTSVLLKGAGVAGAGSFYLYETATESVTPLFSVSSLGRLIVDPGLHAVYFESNDALTPEAPAAAAGSEGLAEGADLYRYDLDTRTLSFIAQVGGAGGLGGGYSTSPDGRTLYFASVGLAGTPASGSQVYRYVASEDLIQCISCASSFDPHPSLGAYFLFGQTPHHDSVPEQRIASADGDYVFFDTTAALVPQDVDGEIAAEGFEGSGGHAEFVRSPSSDTYEWRATGIDGCEHLQGCLALISGGRGGYKTELLGTTPSGRDVFFLTHEALTATDDDTAGDVYDARIGGGFPPGPARPVECEGDACSHPVPAPNDPTPTSEQFRGAGNVKPVVKKPKHKKKHHQKKKGHKKNARAKTTTHRRKAGGGK